MQKYLRHIPKTLKLGVPVVVSQMGHILVGLADSAMVGAVGTVPLAASALANSMFFIILAFGIGLTFGVTPLVASADAEKDEHKSANILSAGILVNLIIGILMALIVWAGSYWLGYLNQPEDVVELAGPYLRVVNVSGLFFVLFQTFKQFAEGLSDTKSAMVITIGANVLNVFLNWVLIFGKFGFEPMGLMGAGYATLISRALMAIAMAVYVLKVPRYARIMGLIVWSKISWFWCEKVLRIGVPSGLQFFFEVGAFAVSAVMIGWLGADELAAHQIALSLAAVTYMLASGLGAASTVRIGNQMGLKDYKTLDEIGISSLLLSIFIMGLAGLGFAVFNETLPRFFVEDYNVISIAASLLFIAAGFQLADGVQVLCLGMLRGMEDTKVPTYYTLISYWLVAIPMGYILGFTFNYGIQGVWAGLCVGLVLVAFLLFFRFRKLSKRLLLNS